MHDKDIYLVGRESVELKLKERFAMICDDEVDQEVVRFKDFLSGEPLSFENTKTCIIDQDPMCRKGLETLERLGAQSLDITFLFGHHGSPEDFYEVLRNASANACLERSSFVAVEANAGLNGEGILVEPRGSGRGSYQRTQMDWLQSRDKLILPCDIDTPEDPAVSGGLLRQKMVEMWGLRDVVNQSAMPPQEKKRLMAVNTLYYHLIREEMMLGQLGYWVYELEKREALNGDRTSIPFMLGSFHRPIAKKAEVYLGAPPTTYDTRPLSERASLFIDIAHQGFASYEQLDRFAEL